MASFGETLRRQRELREISLRQIAEATKINIRYLEALEQNHFEILPGGLFNKGFIRAYAAYVGLDAEGMVNSYLSELAARRQGAVPDRPEPARLHRPLDLPQRRSASARGAATAAAPLSITFAPEGAARPVAAPPPSGAAAASSAPAPPPAASSGPSPAAGPAVSSAGAAPAMRATRFETQPHAITKIADLPPEDRDRTSPRTLLWILTAIVGAGVVLLVLSLLSGPKPVPADLRSPPSAPAGETSIKPEALSAEALEAPAESPGGAAAAAPATPGPAVAGPAAPAPGTRKSADPEPSMAGMQPPAGPARAAAGAPDRAGSGTDASPPAVASPFGPPAAKPPPLPATEPARPARPPRAERARPMALEVTTVWSSWVEVSCDGRTVLDRQMLPGESEAFECDTVIRVSATDAGAVRLRVNDAPCLALGDPGARAYGYTIRIDDFQRICRPEQEEDDGRP